MRYRQQELLAAKSITTAGTEVLDIKTTDVMSRLTAIVRLTNSSWTPTAHPAKAITKVELVDGADVLHSLRGIYTQAMSFYSSRRQPFNYINFTDNGLAVASAPIYFGRDLWDRELALDPKRFTNLQLKVQHNYLGGGAVPDGATLEVWADLFDEDQPSPMGFLAAQSLWSKTYVASTTDYVNLPTGNPIRLVMPAVSSDSEEPDINIDSVKLTENGDKKTLIEAGTLELLQMLESMWPQWVEHFEGRGSSTAVTYYVTPAKDCNLLVITSEDSDTYWNAAWSGGSARTMVSSAGAPTFAGLVTGRCPHGVIPIPMGRMDVMEDWWKVAIDGSRRIKMTGGAGEVACLYELLVQELRSY